MEKDSGQSYSRHIECAVFFRGNTQQFGGYHRELLEKNQYTPKNRGLCAIYQHIKFGKQSKMQLI